MLISEDKQHFLILAITFIVFILFATGSTGPSLTPGSETIVPVVI